MVLKSRELAYNNEEGRLATEDILKWQHGKDQSAFDGSETLPGVSTKTGERALRLKVDQLQKTSISEKSQGTK